MSRKGENIRKRKDGRWEARYPKGRKPDGSIIYGYVYAQKYSEVKQKRLLAMQMLEDSQTASTISTSITYSRFFDQWKKEHRETLKNSSYFLYETMIEKHLRPAFGSLLLEQLTEPHIQTWITQMKNQQLSISYINSILRLFRCILKAVQIKYPSLYSSAIHQPSFIKSPKTIPTVFRYPEWINLESHLQKQDDLFSFGILLSMYTGLRVGELSGLKWEDYDFDNRQLKIRRTVYRIKNSDYITGSDKPRTVISIGTPKTFASLREIPLPGFLAEKMHQFRAENDFFILTGSERCMEPRTIQRRFSKILKIYGIEYHNFHALRHSFATIGIQKGIDYKTMSELLGHASATTTLNVYIHSDMSRKRQCMELFNK